MAQDGGVSRGATGRRPPPGGRAASATAIRADVALACRVLALAGQGDSVWGHVSARDPGDRGFWMKPARIGLEEARAAELLLVGLDGQVLSGRHPRHSEYPIHAELYRRRPDVGAVVHTHPAHANAFSALRLPLRPLSHEGSLFVPPDVPRFSETSDLIITAELGQRVAETMGGGWALFLENHGIVTAGVGVADACIRALLLDKAAWIQLLAGGREKAWTADDEARRKRERIYHADAMTSVWAYLTRRLANER
jgi:L-ribulose-5-phosphate 4-epimerase